MTELEEVDAPPLLPQHASVTNVDELVQVAIELPPWVGALLTRDP